MTILGKGNRPSFKYFSVPYTLSVPVHLKLWREHSWNPHVWTKVYMELFRERFLMRTIQPATFYCRNTEIKCKFFYFFYFVGKIKWNENLGKIYWHATENMRNKKILLFFGVNLFRQQQQQQKKGWTAISKYHCFLFYWETKKKISKLSLSAHICYTLLKYKKQKKKFFFCLKQFNVSNTYGLDRV